MAGKKPMGSLTTKEDVYLGKNVSFMIFNEDTQTDEEMIGAVEQILSSGDLRIIGNDGEPYDAATTDVVLVPPEENKPKKEIPKAPSVPQKAPAKKEITSVTEKKAKDTPPPPIKKFTRVDALAQIVKNGGGTIPEILEQLAALAPGKNHLWDKMLIDECCGFASKAGLIDFRDGGYYPKPKK